MADPWVIPVIDNLRYQADTRHYRPGRGPFKHIELLVLHNTETPDSGNAPSGLWLSTDPASEASIHHLYGRDGTRFDIVARADTAYHAGESGYRGWIGSYKGIATINWVSIGHELESNSTLKNPGDGYTTAQLEALAYTIATEIVTYGLGWDRVITHEQIALPPGRRHDPSHFPYEVWRKRVDEWLAFLRGLSPGELPRWCI